MCYHRLTDFSSLSLIVLHTAEKMDFVFTGDKNEDTKISTATATTPTATEPMPEPVVPRKPAPPKTERSYL